ncbi:transcription initiation factor TFIID subunit 4 isoform X1 [Dicentrarchus labrax]|uniref:TATA-box binding protein associated factor 4 n=1 Tax=Dicentrarchus labrax TaxID=13489 RepID=A0A8C4DVM6_DICLA|nr:transcription initiation factor TFIID subunit 4 isoform X1 [Dicentrarchus labrax]
MRLTSERSWAKMAAGSDLLDDVFFNTEVDEKVVSDIVGSLESELSGPSRVNATARVQSVANYVGNSSVGSNSNVQGSKMGLSQQELAKAGTGVQGGVSNSTGSHGSSMDGATGTTSAAGPSMTAAQTQSKPGAASGVVTVVSDVTSGVGKPGTTCVQTLNGSTVVMNCHIAGGTSADSSGNNSQPAVTLVNNGPVSVSKGSAAVLSAAPSTIIRTSSTSAHNTVISSQPSVKSVPTVTLVRPPMQTPTLTSQSGGNPTTVLTSAAVSVSSATGALVNKFDSTKTIIQTGGHVVASSVATGTTATVRSPTVLQNLRTSVPSTIAATPPGGIRAIAPQVLAPRLTQPQQNAPNIQNIQLPPGMVLVRSDSGQLLMIHQQTLAQMQAQSQSQSAMTPRPAAPTSTPPVQITSLQAPGASLQARPVTPTTIIKQGSTVQTTVTATTTLQRPPVLQNTIMLGGTATTPGQPLGTPTTVQPGSAATAVTQRVGPLGAAGTAVTPTAITAETLENVKKCRNFLSTLIKLASSGKQSSETTANVKELVKNLLEGKIEPEDFTSRLYRELNSSPQPYLVPFLKRSLPALRQMTPDSEAFIQQSLLPQTNTPAAAAASTALTAVVLRPPLSTASTTATSTAATKTTVISLTQAPHSKPGLIVPQQQGTMVRPQVTLAQSPMVTFRGQSHSRIIVGQPQMVKQLQTAVKQTLAPVAKGVQIVSQAPLTAAQRNKLKEAGGGTFRDDDDINDVASMAGVNLSEESARILATNSELVGTVTRSCKDETFLSTSSLTRRALEIGKKFGVSELGTDVINYISHATQQRLQNLLEKVSQVAQQKNITFKEDERYEQVGDVRAQLKFFEQLDQMEKQRKEEQEREILLKAAKSRSRQEDPEQLRLKQKAKEMQQQELAQIRQREANLTALAAIGPRKKRKIDSPVRGASAEGSGSGPSQPGGSGGAGSRQFMRQRITRVNLRDLLFCLENERGTSHSQLLYKGFLK